MHNLYLIVKKFNKKKSLQNAMTKINELIHLLCILTTINFLLL